MSDDDFRVYEKEDGHKVEDEGTHEDLIVEPDVQFSTSHLKKNESGEKSSEDAPKGSPKQSSVSPLGKSSSSFRDRSPSPTRSSECLSPLIPFPRVSSTLELAKERSSFENYLKDTLGSGRIPSSTSSSSLSPMPPTIPPLMMFTPEVAAAAAANHPHSHVAAVAAAVAVRFQPPPAHMGITRPPMYPQYQYPHPVFAEYSHLHWHYPLSASPFRGAYPGSLPVSSASAAGLQNLARFPSPPSGFIPHSFLPHHHHHHHTSPSLPQNSAIVTPGPNQNVPMPRTSSSIDCRRLPSFSSSPSQLDIKHEIGSREDCQMNGTDMSNKKVRNNNNNSSNNNNNKANHIKKPLNAFMLYMKEMRAQVVAECTLKESAAINQILGRRWHALDRAEQSKYYELARQERQLHMKLYPGWSAKDNYCGPGKKKKRKKDKNSDGNNPKKCRARFGLDHQESWCKPCRRKKKCIRYTDGFDNGESEDNFGSGNGSIGEAPTPDSYIDSDHETIRSVHSDMSLIASPSHVPIPPDSIPSSSRPGTLNPNDINNPLSVSQLTQSHHSSATPHHLNPLSPTLSSISLPSPLTDPPSVAPPIVSVT